MNKKTKKQPEKKSTKSTPATKTKAPRTEKKKVATKTAEPPVVAPEETAAPLTTPAPHAPDARLPTPGTLLQKRDRHGAVRCECTVEESGIRYEGSIYKSLSAAAMAAAKDLGLTNKTQNGFVFWGLSKPPRRSGDPLTTLERAWERYHGNVEALVKDGVTDENRTQVIATIRKHAQAIESLGEKVA